MDEKDSGRPRGREIEVPGLSPVRAFFLVCALATVVGGGIFATREAAPSEPPAPPRSPDYTLTDAEAIAEFERLNAQLMQAYEERNIALAEDVFTSDSPMLPRVRLEIDDLIDSNVESRTRFDERSTTVVDQSSSRVVIERTEVLYPRFVAEDGTDATGSTAAEKRVVRWELRVQAGTWLIHESTVVSRKAVPQRGRE